MKSAVQASPNKEKNTLIISSQIQKYLTDIKSLNSLDCFNLDCMSTGDCISCSFPPSGKHNTYT